MIRLSLTLFLISFVLFVHLHSCTSLKNDADHSVKSLQKASNQDEDQNEDGDQSGSLLSCYDCSAHNPDCGVKESTIETGCKACLVYLNVHDGNNVIRRCCKSGCGKSGTISEYEGRQASVCTKNLCNGIGSEQKLPGYKEVTTTTRMTTTSTTTVTTTAVTTTTAATTTVATTTPVKTSFSCYECGSSNSQGCNNSVMMNCPMCMISRNDQDPTKFDRRCCWWGCGAANQVSNFNGRPTYFCNADYCNGPSSEMTLGSITTTTKITTTTTMTTMTTSTTTKITTTTTMTTMTTSTTTAFRQTSSQCYDCSGPDCGKEASTLSMHCPMCMVYRNPDDQTKIERRCCWWACGSPNTVTNYNGRETYFCATDKCNGPGAESILSPPITTTTTTAMTTTTTTTTTTGCNLTCQNSGILERESRCVCHCLEYTSGRQCEQVDCAQPDIDADICSAENEVLCSESETFAFECRHLCGKCSK